jgi:hypothetical protein
MKMSIKRFEIERVCVTSSMPFEAVVAALKDAIGQLDLVEFAKVSKQAGTFTYLKEVIDRNPGKTGRQWPANGRLRQSQLQRDEWAGHERPARPEPRSSKRGD